MEDYSAVKERISERLEEMYNKRKSIIDMLEEYKKEDGYSYISQKHLAEKLGMSQTYVSKNLRDFEEFGAVAKIKPGVYAIIKPEKFKYLINLAGKINALALQLPEIERSYKIQSELLKVSLKDIQRGWGILYHLWQE